MKGLSWKLLAVAFSLMIAGAFVAEDVWRVGGIVIVCVGAVFALAARLVIDSRL
ncbi:MAG: hypothetical protein ABI427_06945 [Solirubrobacteraceae bacterium]